MHVVDVPGAGVVEVDGAGGNAARACRSHGASNKAVPDEDDDDRVASAKEPTKGTVQDNSWQWTEDEIYEWNLWMDPPHEKVTPSRAPKAKVDKPAKRKAAASDDSSTDMEVVRKKTFARRFMPSSPVLKARWLAMRSAFEDRILPKVTKFATHEASVPGFMYLATYMFVCFGKLLHLIAHMQVQYWNFCMSEWVEVDLDEDNVWDLATECAQKYLSTIDSSTE